MDARALLNTPETLALKPGRITVTPMITAVRLADGVIVVSVSGGSRRSIPLHRGALERVIAQLGPETDAWLSQFAALVDV